jgi:hypothetical protein
MKSSRSNGSMRRCLGWKVVLCRLELCLFHAIVLTDRDLLFCREGREETKGRI